MPAGRVRSLSAVILLCLAALVAAAAIVLLYVRAEIAGPDRFADRAADSVQAPAVRDALARAITEDVIERARPDAIVARPLIESAVAGVVGSSSIRSLVHAAASDLYEASASDGEATVLVLSDAAVVAIEALRQYQPEVAAHIPASAEQAAIDLGEEGLSSSVLGRVDEMRPLALALAGLAVALLAAGIAVAPSRRAAAGWAGLAVAAAGALVAVGEPLARRAAASAAGGETADVVREIWDAFLDDIRPWSLAAVAIGLVVWLAARGRLRADALAASARRAVDWATAPPVGAGRAATRGVLVLVAAVVIAVAWRSLLEVAALGLAALVGVQGLGLLMAGVAPGPPPEPGARESLADRARRARKPLLAAAAVAGVIGLAVAIVLGTRGGPTHGPEEVTACNGSPALCGRGIDEVSLAATHNSMAAADEPGWLLAEHTGGIAAQLRFGVRGFLIDVWYGAPSDRGVATDFYRSGIDRADLVREYGEEAVAAVERLRGRLGFGQLDQESSLYLCHVACEIGATPLDDALRDVRRFLEDNPGEVLILVIQDQVDPQDTRRAFLRNGLREYALTPPADGSWPTLGEMIDSGERVIVMNEKRTDPEIPWMLPAFGVMEETPYDVPSPQEMDCRPNRGGTGKPFFQLNHWIAVAVPTVSDAQRINARDFLLPRARRCEKERKNTPSLVAVNFYATGALLETVAALNGVPPPS